MEEPTTIGVRALKTHLSHHLKRVQSGHRVVVTDRGRAIATIEPVESRARADWAHQLVAAGLASWTGGKPRGTNRPLRSASRSTVSAAVVEDRR